MKKFVSLLLLNLYILTPVLQNVKHYFKNILDNFAILIYW